MYQPNSILTYRQALTLSALLAITIGLVSLTPLAAFPLKPPGGDKVHHFLAFTTLTIWLPMQRPRDAFWLLPLAVLYGGLIELIQPYVNRWAEWEDFLADSIGAITGTTIGLAIFLNKKQTRKNY